MPVISTNTAANVALNYLNNNSSLESSQLAKLASGSRITQASDDAAGLAIGTQLQASTTVYQQDETNVQQGSAILQTTDGALAQISNILQRMMALATEAASGQITNTQRTQDIGTEYSQLSSQITTIVDSTRYAGVQLLSGSFLSNVKFLVGTTSADTIGVSLSALTLTSLGLTGSVGTAAQALHSITAINSAINIVTKQRAQVGAYESRFNFSLQDIQTNVQNTQAATSVIMDADVAQVKSALSATDVRTQASVAALTQASQLPQELLKLLQA
ncbi:flagellar filament 30.7 kDa core protein [mine drainage metagenome]|uniref:Flagellar filament 30.7 kDa core protein n=1 Tax=mine drainage metagenome TaxID=410659 RepID=A0A1J5QU06_9ZZZZ